MMRARRPLTIVVMIAAAALGAATWTAQAQSPQSPSATMSGMDQMMHHAATTGDGSDDPRKLVSLPAPMQEHMLASMRDHLATLNTVIGEVSEGKFDSASKLLEARLGMSSLPLHHAAEMAPYFPQGMQDAGTRMHHSASRLAIALQDASVAHTYDAMRRVDAAMHEVTSACVACHAAYRIH